VGDHWRIPAVVCFFVFAGESSYWTGWAFVAFFLLGYCIGVCAKRLYLGHLKVFAKETLSMRSDGALGFLYRPYVYNNALYLGL
jgi:hypothetical protein